MLLPGTSPSNSGGERRCRNPYAVPVRNSSVESVEVSTVVYVPPEEVYEFLIDFPRYAHYSEHLREVRQRGDGGPGTEYALRFSWWKLTYTAHSRVTDVDPPERIDWEVLKDVNARGYWRIEPTDPPDDREVASEVRLRVAFHPESANERALDLPAFVSLDWVIEKVKPKVQREARRVVRRIVADLEGEPRNVDLRIQTNPGAV